MSVTSVQSSSSPGQPIKLPVPVSRAALGRDRATADDEAVVEAVTKIALLVEGRSLIRDCFERCIRRASDLEVVAVATVDDCLDRMKKGDVELAVLILDGAPDCERNLETVKRLVQSASPVPVIVVSDGDDIARVRNVMKAGVRGYISTSMALDVAVEAIRLVRAGGQFVPAASILVEEVRSPASDAEHSDRLGRIFTARQAAVVDALRKGMANKVIAYELNMQESTVKVHVRNIMKKLKARNRTEVAYLANRLLD